MEPRTEKRKPEGVSTKKFASIRGVSPQAIHEAEKRGLIVRFPDRSIDVAASVRLLDENQDPRKGPIRDEPNPLEALLDELDEDGEAPPAPAAPTATSKLNAERARHERIKREAAELKLARAKAEVVDVKEAGRVWFALCRKLRQRIAAIPARVSPSFAALDDPHEIRETLATELDEALSMLPEDVPLP